MQLLRITKADDALVVEGELDLAGAQDLHTAVLDAAASGTSVVDLSGVSFIDSTGLQTLIRAGRSLNGSGPLVLRAPSRPVRRLLEIAMPQGAPEIQVR